jgi:hypothetical protein
MATSISLSSGKKMPAEMKIYFLSALYLMCLVISVPCYSQKDSAKVHKSERKVIVSPNPFKDSTQISITGIYHLNSLKISIQKKSGQAVLEFIPKQVPFKVFRGDLDPGLYYVRCIDRYGRIPSKRMTIKGESLDE